MIVHVRRLPPTLEQRRAAFRNRWAPALTAALCVTAGVALVGMLLAALNLSPWMWAALAYVLAAGGWGGYRAADAPAVQMGDRDAD